MQAPDFLRRRRVLLLSVALFLVIFGTFSPALHNGFVGYDDPEYVTSNWRVQEGLNWGGLKWAFGSCHAGNWHPLTWISHQCDVQLFGMRAWGHHLTSILFHAANGALLFLALRALTGSVWRSALVALLFGIHPLRVESAVWVSERKDLLSATFFLLTLLAYAAYAERGRLNAAQTPLPGAVPGRLPAALSQAPGYYLLCLALFALGLMSKPMVVTLPCVLLLLDYWPLRRFQNVSPRALVLEKAPFFLLALAAGLVTVAAQHQGGAFVDETAWPGRLGNALVSYARYIGKLLWPVRLSPFYPPVPEWPLSAVLGSAGLLGCLFLAAFLTRKRLPFLIVGWLWFFGMLIPVIGLVPVGEQSMADRYSYLPSIGFWLAVIWGGHELSARRPWFRFPCLALVCFASALWIRLSWTQTARWRDTQTLFSYALRLDPANYVALNNLGASADQQGRLPEAIDLFTRALKCRPQFVQARNNLGIVLLKTGRVESAVEQFRLALQAKPLYADTHNNLGSALERQGLIDEALVQFAEACELNPAHADAQYNLGLLLMRKGRFAEAIPRFQAAIELQPASADAHNNLGFAFQQLRQFDAAASEYRRAVALRPDYARAHFNLGVVLYEKGLIDEAIAEFQTALRIKPDYAEAQKNLEALLNIKR